jgi:hypothetical protein
MVVMSPELLTVNTPSAPLSSLAMKAMLPLSASEKFQ